MYKIKLKPKDKVWIKGLDENQYKNVLNRFADDVNPDELSFSDYESAKKWQVIKCVNGMLSLSSNGVHENIYSYDQLMQRVDV